MRLAASRKFVTPRPGDDWEALARRCDVGVEQLKSYNLHLFTRIPPGQILGSDVVFVEPPRPEGAPGG